MMESNTNIQEYESSSVVLNEFEIENSTNTFSNYVEKIKTADIGQVKIYLGFAYFAVLVFFSITLFL